MTGVALRISFPWGRYHATPWDRAVNESAIEWPPSPWRVLRALYATYMNRAPHLDEEVVGGLLERLATAPRYLLPVHVEAHTRHYYPDEKYGTDKVFDSFVVLERNSELFLQWPVELKPDQQEALADLARRLPYLGRADSICNARMLTDEEETSLPSGLRTCAPSSEVEEIDDSETTTIDLLVPDSPLDLEALIVRSADLRKQRRIDPPGTSWVTYRCPHPATPSPPRHRTVTKDVTAVRWAIATPARPAVSAAVSMAEALRQASLSASGRRGTRLPSPLLAGKDHAGVPLTGHRHAHYLAFVADPERTGHSRLDTLVVWIPAGLSEADLAALGSLRRLGGRSFASDFRTCRLGLEGYGRVEDIVPELVGPATTWQSFTPFAPPRHGRRRTAWRDHVASQITDELARRDKPAPSRIELLPGPWLNFRRHRLTECLADARRAFGVRIVFEEAVRGPLVLGALSHFGLGLMSPEE